MTLLLVILFISGYILIALEHQTGISKSAIALLLGILLWTFIPHTDNEIINHLGDTAEILFYLLGTMTIVEWIDTHNGFTLITNHITTRNKRKLLWIIALITFIMSSVLDNLTTAIVMIMLLRRLGDVTTIMLWINDNITSLNVIHHLFLPSLISLIIPLVIMTFRLQGETQPQQATNTNTTLAISRGEQMTILSIGIASLLFVPVFKEFTNLPPFMGIMLALGGVWTYTEILYNRKRNLPPEKIHRIPSILTKIDYSTLLFFLGILMAVATLQIAGILDQMSTFLNDKIHNVYLINMIIGFLSSVIDNVPLVAAAIGMYPLIHTSGTLSPYLMNFTTDGTFWELLAYCAGIGGSILIIGSAAGVVVMGMERINFMWYMKHITWIALLGYLAGIGVYYLQSLL